MKIKVIVPVSTKIWNESVTEEYNRIKRPFTQIEVVNIEKGPEAIQSEYDEASAAPHVLKEIKNSQKNSCDAIIIYCFSDPALAGAREISTIPIVGIGESSQLLAMSLADRIGIVATLDHSVSRIRRKLNARGFSSRFPSIRPLNIPVLDYDHPEKIIDRVSEVCGFMVNNDGVEALILGCGSLLKLREKLYESLSIPIVIPGEAALKHAESLIELGLTQSKKSFRTPLTVEYH